MNTPHIRLISVILILILLVFLPLITFAEEGTKPEKYKIVVADAGVKQHSGYISFAVKLKNSSDIGIAEFDLRYRFFNGFGDRLYDYNNTIDEYSSELTVLSYSPIKEIKPKKTYTVKENYLNYLTAKEIQVAISYYRSSDGKEVIIPDNQLQWFSSKSGFITNLFADACTYTKPSQEVISRSESFRLGIYHVLLHKEDASRVFFSRGGLWLSDVDKDSIAESCGLKTGDLVIKLDEVDALYDPYALEIAKARMADGKSVQCLVERNGEEITLELKK